jgi:flagellar biosynthesis protein FlhF
VPPETFTGAELPALFAQARSSLGAEAVVLAVRRRGTLFELEAAAGGEAAARARSRAGAPRLAADGRAQSAMRPAWPSPATDGPAIIALVGPTGAGKTTTIAKLANHPAVFGGRAVGLLSLDTYRIGAVEQSRVYAELSGLPLEVVYEEAELGGALRRLRDRDVVLVDTPGRSPRRRQDLSALKAQLGVLSPVETHLALPAGLQAAHARELLAAHRGLGVTHLLATKLDECPGDGVLFELALEQGLPMRWVADGQEVPRDLEHAARRLARVEARRLRARVLDLAEVA